MMQHRFKSIIAALILLAGLFAVGCQTQDPKDSQIPWSRPAGWENEGNMPGM